jgi:hypothetical protein
MNKFFFFIIILLFVFAKNRAFFSLFALSFVLKHRRKMTEWECKYRRHLKFTCNFNHSFLVPSLLWFSTAFNFCFYIFLLPWKLKKNEKMKKWKDFLYLHTRRKMENYSDIHVNWRLHRGNTKDRQNDEIFN